MTAWTGYDTDYFGSIYFADLGYYIGPYPPPLPVFLPVDAAEVDIFVARPPLSGSPVDWNPFVPTFPYESQFGDGYLYWNGDPGDLDSIVSGSYTADQTPPYTRPTTAPPGAHLWVLWYPPAAASPIAGVPVPSVSPEELVPSELFYTAISPGYTLASITSYRLPAYAAGATDVSITRYFQPSYAQGRTVVTVHGVPFGPSSYALAVSRGATAVHATAAVDGALVAAAYTLGATAVTVRSAGPINGAAESDGATSVSVQAFQGTEFGSAESDGSTFVYIRYFPDLSDNDPVPLCVHLDGQLSYNALVDA